MVKAIDDRNGDLTELIQVNTDGPNLNEPSEYIIRYSVSDSSGNEVTKKIKITVLKDKAPSLKALSHKFAYINEKIDYMNGITAEDEKDGNLTSKIKVDSSKVDIKSAGVYKVIYSVTDSLGSKTKKSILVTVKKNEIVTSENYKTST